MNQELWRRSAVELAAMIRSREVSCVEVTEAVLGRIARHNGRINAIVVDCGEDALRAAERKDREAGDGTTPGPLHGVPVTIKENIDVAGQATPNGLPAYADVIAPDHSPVTRNLLGAGAIIVGRTNTPELSMRATTDNPLRGRTLNPWDEEASPGGSSGGGSAAAAMGFGPIHHGNDIGGSLRFPSFACGLATVKPTLGRVPAYNPSAAAERGLLAQLCSVQGVMCREVRDVRLGTRVLAGGDARDPWWVPVPFDGPALAPPIKVAVTCETHGYPINPQIVAGIERAADVLSDAGYAVERVETPSIMKPAQAWFDVLASEIAHFLGPAAREHGSATIRAIFDHYQRVGNPVDAAGYRQGIADRTALTREWSVFLDSYPLVLCPFLMRSTYAWDYDAQGFEQVKDLFRSAIYSTGINYLSLPAGVVPIGFADGLPAGVQIVGRRYREDLILDAMETVEASVGILAHELWRREEGGA
ncbi:MAG: amidase [Rhodospirillales bacterium]|nr:amidase [Rhodospirillales bacterium]MDE0380564.1 amidase [Rhodospirillales bacterium]